MVELTLERIVKLAGDWQDESRASEQFREIIEDEQTTTEEIESYLEEAVGGSEQFHNRALQDLVNNIGRRLGFRVEYGVYQGRSGTIGFDGHWISGDDGDETHIVVESKKTTAYSIQPSQAGQYMEELTESEELARDQVYGLIVVGSGDIETIAQTVFGSQYRDRMRVITAERLLDLLSIQEDSGLRHDQIVDVLLPINTVDVGQLVGLIQEVIEFREGVTGGTDGGPRPEGIMGDEWNPRTGADAIEDKISRRSLEDTDDDAIAVFPSQTSGVEFLKENNGWGFVRINQTPKYVAMYISDGIQEVRYVARVKDIVPATEAQLARPLESYVGDQAEFDEDKKVVVFKPGSLYELEDPIEYGSRVPYSLRYTDLGRFKNAETTDDIL